MIQDLFKSCFEKQALVKARFVHCSSQEMVYQMIIDMGRGQPRLGSEQKIEENLVPGCQSRMYLASELRNNRLYFQTEADALISAGLGQLLTAIYSDEEPEVVLKCPPLCIQELGIAAALTPGRANGLASLYYSMKKRALMHLAKKEPA